MSAARAVVYNGRTMSDTSDTSNLNGKVALVTGASRGIGAAVLNTLADSGATVVGTATSAAGLEGINTRGSGLVYNAKDSGAAAQLAQEVEAQHGGVDILVLNAAINADGLLMRMKAEDWQEVLNINLSAGVMLSQALLRGMLKKRWGRIIFISSVVASIGNPGQTNYCAAKAGVEGYCRALAREVAARGITVNAVAPGFIQTDMSEKLPDAVKEHFVKNIPAGSAGQPQDVANAVRYLAGAGAGYVTGQVLHVNGGLYMG